MLSDSERTPQPICAAEKTQGACLVVLTPGTSAAGYYQGPSAVPLACGLGLGAVGWGCQ